MKRFLSAILFLIVLCLGVVWGQHAGSLAPAVAKATPPATVEDKNETSKQNHSSLIITNKPATTVVPPAPVAVFAPPAPLPLTETYRVGPGDVLDIRLLNFSSRQSSLYTVRADGTLEYAYLSEPLKVSGLTPEEIVLRLNSLIKVFDQPQAIVNMRHYASHNVTISGLAHKTGPQPLQREAVPLYVILTLVQPKPEAERIVLTRAGQPAQEFKLAQAESLDALILPGDEITFLIAPPPPPQPKEFIYLIGTVNMPGQKEFHSGLTLTQAIFAAGGLSKGKDAKVRILRQATDNRLAATEYSLKRISQGKDPDPSLQAGDRLEVISKD